MSSPLQAHLGLQALFFNNIDYLLNITPQPTLKQTYINIFSSPATIASLRPTLRLGQLTHHLHLRTMASTSSPSVPQEAPWKKTFLDHISQMDSPEFVFSSLHQAPDKSNSPTPYLPRARFCIYRGMWAQLPENKHNTAPMNERIFESEMPTFTTDVRMQKTFELFNSSAGHADSTKLTQGSGGGGPCEAVWWVKGETMVQWRIKGVAYIVGPDIESDEESSGVRTVKSELGERMRVVKEEGREGWGWGREVTACFGNISPGMRGSFANPPPGKPVDQSYDDQKLKLGQKVEDLEDPVARENFRVVVIKPEVVESVDQKDPPANRRHVWTFDKATGGWEHQECWP
ncbi:unnamed protein product [Zymoseptoria tritici ST99CH_1E4]|uniref:Pyridoxamine 5'-phosphate oxidase Alr4036 family FMN-binding domain-containing protein n=1 Tax=Zymoseptoria tritici ST99CH_1E4 TaxID=1276532 RepID=A0A2H1GYQ2_ZYMTR|nr:unnamed protein product [Zymoseptoria tritici ST99CH_1E4]